MTNSTHGTADEPLVARSFNLQAGSVDIGGEPEPQPVVFFSIRSATMDQAHLAEVENVEHHFMIQADYARRIGEGLIKAADAAL